MKAEYADKDGFLQRDSVEHEGYAEAQSAEQMEESSGSQSGTEESTAEETTDATAESAEQTQAQPVVYLLEEVLKCRTWKNKKDAGEEMQSELQKNMLKTIFSAGPRYLRTRKCTALLTTLSSRKYMI